MKPNQKSLIVGLAVAVILTNYGCTHATSPGNNPNPNPLPLTSSEKLVESANNAFATNLFGQIAIQESGKDFFISPLSVSMALAMTLNGANGQTYVDMQNTLGLNGLTNDEINQSYQNLIGMFGGLDQNVKFNIANSIWYRNTFSVLKTFLSVDSIYYNAEVDPLDFNASNATDIVNGWVSDKTNGKIPNIIDPPIPPGVVMYIMNALYFNGTWKYTFSDTSNAGLSFHLADGTTQMDSMMVVHDTLNYFSDSSFEAVELPYGDGDYSMVVLLPSNVPSTANAVALNQKEWTDILGGLTPRDVQMTMPKFKIQYFTKLKNALSQMGMGIAFSGNADFTRINPNGGLTVSDVLHKTYIDVNEKGTEAAAVTVVIVATWDGGGPHTGPYFVNVNRPFIFLIKENHSNTVMFMGEVADPAAVSSN